MARRVPEPIEKCAVRSASPISTTLPKLHCRFVPDRRKLAPVGLVGKYRVAVQVLCEHLLAMADGLLLGLMPAKPARCQVASSTSTRKVLMRGL
jgi:hypothetical protein